VPPSKDSISSSSSHDLSILIPSVDESRLVSVSEIEGAELAQASLKRSDGYRNNKVRALPSNQIFLGISHCSSMADWKALQMSFAGLETNAIAQQMCGCW
jgi:hypothetical protein